MRWLVRVLLVLTIAGCATWPTPDPNAFLAPDFGLTSLGGHEVRLSDFRGRWVVLNFWATWCAPCVDEMPALQALADATVERAVVLGVNLREEAADVSEFAAAHGIRFPLLLHPDDATVVAYSVVGLPQTLLIDPQGVVVMRAFGPVDVAALSEQMR